MEILSMEFIVVSVIVFIIFAIIWFYQFISLMLFADSDFPAKYDKILWVAAFICIFLVAPLAFMYWKPAYLSLRTEERKQSESDTT